MVAELSIRISGGPGAPAEARDVLRRFHPELAPELMQIVALLASELVSNAVRHAGAEWVEVCFGVASEHVRIEVGDNGKGFAGKPRVPVPGRPGGWGLYIVEQLASRWGVMQDGGTRVWFEIDR